MEILEFILVYFIFTCSTIGYGNIFSKYLTQYNKEANIGFTGLYGFFLLTLISYLTNIFFNHGNTHNYIILIFGIIFFLKFFFSLSNSKNYNDRKYFIFFFVLSLFSVLYFKSHDDFLYYHLSLTNNITINKVEFGLGIFDLAFNHLSSLFFYHSLFKLPFSGDYFYFLGPAIIMIFVNIILINNILKKKSKLLFNDFLYIFIFVFINIFFYRLAEHGTDRSAIILILLTITLVFSIIDNNRPSKKKIENLIILVTIIVSLKSFYVIYSLLFFAVYLKYYRNKNIFLFFKSFKILLIAIFFASLMTFYNIAYTGCFIYPIPTTCLNNFYWGMPAGVIADAANWYELWSKAGASPNFKVANPDEYIQFFNWVPNWIHNYFFNKVSDFVLGLVFVLIIFFLIFKPSKINFNTPKSYLPIFGILILFFLEWFYNHPSLRYGGYHLIALLFFIPCALILSNQKFKFLKKSKNIQIILLITIIIFSGRNINRIINENKIYNYNPFSSPYYRLSKEYYLLKKRKSVVLKNTKSCKEFFENEVNCKIISSYRIFYKND